jgi:iron complex outermembrane receptor protein
VKGCAGSVTLSPTAPAILFTNARPKYLPSEDQCENNTVTANLFPGARSAVSQNLPKQEFKKLTYTFGVNWQITPDAMVYGTTRRGYRAGSYNTPLFDQAFLGQVQTFRPETLEDWEIGTKLRWRAGGMRGSFDFAAFTGKDKNYQLPVATSALAGGVCVPQAITASRPANCTTTTGVPGVTIVHSGTTTILNGGELTIRGFEAAGTVSPMTGLTIGAGVAHVDYKVDEVSLDPNLLALLQAGNQTVPTTVLLQQQPRWTYNVDIDYVYPDKVLESDLSLNVNFKYSEKFVSTAAGIINPAYNLWDARLTFGNIGDSGLDIAAFVKNITNNYYSGGVASGTPGTLGVISYSIAPPRTYGIAMRYTFGR